MVTTPYYFGRLFLGKLNLCSQSVCVKLGGTIHLLHQLNEKGRQETRTADRWNRRLRDRQEKRARLHIVLYIYS